MFVRTVRNVRFQCGNMLSGEEGKRHEAKLPEPNSKKEVRLWKGEKKESAKGGLI